MLDWILGAKCSLELVLWIQADVWWWIENPSSSSTLHTSTRAHTNCWKLLKYCSRAPNIFWADLPKFGVKFNPDGEELGPDGGHLTWVELGNWGIKAATDAELGSRTSSAESFGIQKLGREFLTEWISYKRWTGLAFGRHFLQIHIQIHVQIHTRIFIPIHSVFHWCWC